jgi:hypothetical protein
MTTVTRFDRLEFKFIVGACQRRRLSPVLAEHLVPDPHGDSAGAYPVVSVYYDNEQHDIYWEHIQELRSRRKLRVRVYGSDRTAARPACFVEIKHRLDGRIVKRRALLPLDHALAVVNGGEPPRGLPELEQGVVEEARAMVAARGLRPTCVIRYDRQALRGTGPEADLRITFDTNLSYRLNDLVPRPDDRAFDRVILNGGAAVLEVKVAETVPFWLSELLAQEQCLLQSHSKYCRIVEANGRDQPAEPIRLQWSRRASGRMEAAWTR